MESKIICVLLYATCRKIFLPRYDPKFATGKDIGPSYLFHACNSLFPGEIIFVQRCPVLQLIILYKKSLPEIFRKNWEHGDVGLWPIFY